MICVIQLNVRQKWETLQMIYVEMNLFDEFRRKFVFLSMFKVF